MTILNQLESFIFSQKSEVFAGSFRGVLEGNDIPYRQGWDEQGAYVFSINEAPDVEFLFSDEDYGTCIGVVKYLN